MSDRREPYENALSDTLSRLMHDQIRATTEPPELSPRGRKRKRYPSEDRRVKLTIDIDLEPSVARVLRALAEMPPHAFGMDPIRVGDLATVALMVGLIEFANERMAVEAEWTSHSRGRRNLAFLAELDVAWDTLLQDLDIERNEET